MSAALLLAAAMSALPPRPEAPGRESWKFCDELAAHEDAPAWKGAGEPWLKERISRCFFGPIKREPYNRDELMDDIDYYPDGYLEKLSRDGVNGLWITVEFHEIAETRFFPRDKNAERRLAKLRRTVDKCAKYGIKVWIFALEPKWLNQDHPFRRANPQLFVQHDDHFAMCPELPEVKEYLESAAFDVFSRVPGLGGFMGITHGEDITSCFSYAGRGCPRCEKLPCWRLHNDIVGAIVKGARRANPSARVISWFYQPESRVTRPDWVYECAAHLPDGVSLMYNFESGSLVKQLDRWHIGGDYWLSQPGPGMPFAKFAEVAHANGTGLAAKIQMACSHEDATVPYVPVPGLLYRKFRAMKACGVTSSLLSWYFGNYPCVMSKAAGRLAYEDFADGEEAFLGRLAAEDWGRQAPRVAALWKAYSDAYGHYPLSNYMQYYGPFHAGLVWALRPRVDMHMLEPTWMPHYEPAGDAIGECLRDFSIDEALSLATAAAEMPEPDLVAENRAQELDIGVMKTVRRQFRSARNIFDFYRARSQAIYDSRVLNRHSAARQQIRRMREIVADERKTTLEMIPLCERDSRLGFHSEAEAHQFFPARLQWRVGALDRAEEDLEDADRTIANGGTYPESDWEAHAPRMYLDFDKWTEGADGFKVRVYRLAPGDVQFEGEVPAALDSVCVATYDAAAVSFPLTYGLSRDGRLTSPFWDGEPRSATPATLRTASLPDGGWSFTLVVPASVWRGEDRLRPEWAFWYAEGKMSLWPADGEGRWLNRLHLRLEPRQFGRIVYAPPPQNFCDKPYEPVARSTDTNNWYGARMKEKREAIASSNGAFDLVLVGDSITHFWEKCSWFGTNGLDELVELKKKYSVLDLGFAGDGTEHVIWRLQNGQSDGYKAKCFMLMIGTNNKQGPVEDVARGVEKIVGLLRERHPESKVILVSVLPRDICPDDPMRVRFERLNAQTQKLVDGRHVIRLDMTRDFLTPEGFLNIKLFCPDRLHLSPDGYRVWRERAEPLFRACVGR